MNKKGLLVVDNILWEGEVINVNSKDKLTKIKKFNLHVKKSKINKYILPIGDGFVFVEIMIMFYLFIN